MNGGKSKEMSVERGLMEGHPPSMAAFVLVLIPLMIILERILQGIEVECKRHKLKGFADDLKLFLKRPEEIKLCYIAIERFESVSGLKMHRDPARGKCQALMFGQLG